MAILEAVKKVLRIDTGITIYDDEITTLIEACKIDLKTSGLLVVDETDEIVKQAIQIYSKIFFGYDNSDASRLTDAYNSLKSHLATSREYAYYEITFQIGEQNYVIFDDVKKETDDSGEVIFLSRVKNHVEYTTKGITGYVDVTGNQTVIVV